MCYSQSSTIDAIETDKSENSSKMKTFGKRAIMTNHSQIEQYQAFLVGMPSSGITEIYVVMKLDLLEGDAVCGVEAAAGPNGASAGRGAGAETGEAGGP